MPELTPYELAERAYKSASFEFTQAISDLRRFEEIRELTRDEKPIKWIELQFSRSNENDPGRTSFTSPRMTFEEMFGNGWEERLDQIIETRRDRVSVAKTTLETAVDDLTRFCEHLMPS